MEKYTEANRFLKLLITTVVCCALIGAVLVWKSGILFRIDKQVSPNGQIIAEAFSRNVTGAFEDEADGITIRSSGQWSGETLYPDSTFDYMAWSPDSRYLVVQMVQEGEHRMVLEDYVNNSSSNLDAYFLMALYDDPHFKGVDFDTVKYYFLCWDAEEPLLHASYFFVDDRVEHRGTFWYDHQTVTATEVTPH